MKFYSTNKQSEAVSFREAVIKSLPTDKGLYFPEEVPELDYLFLETLDYYSLPEIGMEVLRQFTKEDIPEQKLNEILHEALDFEIPVKEVEKNIHTLELFHGPTYAFKDVGARFLARCLGYFNETENKEVTILVATSGDTGGAVASGFHNVPGVNVVILYPSGKVSDLQEKQLTTLGGNITALEVEGDFDACQAMVKQAFLDADINSKLNLSSANSINIARWLPQSIYFFEAYKQLKDAKKLVVAVPSGNYGNITAGMLAKKMGLDIHRFIAASNANDTVPRYLKDGNYEVKPTVPTLSNAMDVSDPSNHPRMLELHEQNFKDIIKHTQGFTLNDQQTLDVMKSCYASNQYILDPHGAIGYQALKEKLEKKETGVFLETAHYSKFLSTVEQALDQKMDLPDFVSDLMTKEKVATKIGNSYDEFKAFLLG
ncbi:MAG: threonine synthase [Flammeovirgaceae bacterium]|nr:threonine synthase [Flammeovirgaceae bacterium]HCX20880.1 threonine synthase [Cytophagales bacterium]|tara:strand:- start:5287 stop:6573 length:1287 start_codon:yes stop_codon:yes gene_type:complete